MLLDVLSGLDELKICTAYEIDGKQHHAFPQPRRRPPPRAARLRNAARLAGRDHRPAARCDELPANARAYLTRISELVGRPIEMVSVGPERDRRLSSSKS